MSLLSRLPGVRRLVAPRLAVPRWRRAYAGPRVLVEEPDTVLGGAMASALRDNGYQVVECEGPGAHSGAHCPLLTHGSCDAVHGADVVVQVLEAGKPALGDVRAAINAHEPDLPIALIVPGPASAQLPEPEAGSTLVAAPLTRDGVVAAVRAVGTRPR